jgi:predicted NAD/FAD-dependent oxidoreductase
VIGTGIAGAACAQALSLAGHGVSLFDKARGPGGRMATRRADWVDASGQARTTRFNHGAVAIAAGSEAFQAFVRQARHAGWLVEWAPTLAAHSLPLEHDGPLHLPLPGMSALCRHLLGRLPARWSFEVEQLQQGARGWQLRAEGEHQGTDFDAVVLALPPAQATPLLGAHRPDWARRASVASMQPCWTLMGVAQAGEAGRDAALPWDLAQPAAGPLACIVRSDLLPGSERVQGQAQWVLHARAGWSRRHLEQPQAWVQQQLQDALGSYLGHPVTWLHCTVHRWRYAMPQAHGLASADGCWWDPTRGLGVCGDFLGGASIEGAWASGRALSQAMLESAGHESAWARQA